MRGDRVVIFVAFAVVVSSCATARYAANADYPQIGEAYNRDGILEECFYDCSVPGPSRRRMYVYLPADYYETQARYPVLYLLHGARGNETSWIIKGNFLHHVDSLTASGKMAETIVVLPNTNEYKSDRDYGKSRLKGAMESFFEVDGAVEYAFVNDVVRTVDSLYRTLPQKDSRALAGLSIGALQSIYISAANPDCFGYIGLFSPIIRPTPRFGGYSSFFRQLKQKHKLQFQDPPYLYWVMIGEKDYFFPRASQFCIYLGRNSYPYEHFFTTGGHDWSNWTAYCDKFMERLWKQ